MEIAARITAPSPGDVGGGRDEAEKDAANRDDLEGYASCWGAETVVEDIKEDLKGCSILRGMNKWEQHIRGWSGVTVGSCKHMLCQSSERCLAFNELNVLHQSSIERTHLGDGDASGF